MKITVEYNSLEEFMNNTFNLKVKKDMPEIKEEPKEEEIKPKEEPKTETEVKEEPKEEHKITADELLTAFKNKTKEGKSVELKAILKEKGYRNVSAVKEEDREEILKKVEAV